MNAALASNHSTGDAIPRTRGPRHAGTGSGSEMLGMVAAFRWEVQPLLRKQSRAGQNPHVKGLQSKLYSLTLGGEPVVLAIAGAGAENSFRVARELAENFPLRGLATLGFAGALVPGLRAGDIILGDHVLDEATGERFDCQSDLFPVRFTRRGSLLSVDGVVSSAAQKLRLGEQWGALAVDMESAGVARAAALAGLPFGALKSITDSAEESLSIDFSRCRREDKNFSFWAIARQGISTSKGARDLWRLAWSSRQAAGRLAAALVAA